MTTGQHIPQEDLYLFALQLLPETEMHAAALHLKECEQCRTQVGEMQGDMVAYAMTAEMQAPPSRARERLLEQIAKEKKFIAPDPVEEKLEPVLYPRNSRMFQVDATEEKRSKTPTVMAWLGWAAAASLAIAGGLQYQQRTQLQLQLSQESAKLDAVQQNALHAESVLSALTDPKAMQVAMHIPVTPNAPVNFNPEGHVTYVPAKGSLLFVATHLDPLQQYKTYELWLLPAEGSPIPAGLFKPDANGNATVVMPKLPQGVLAKGFGVTVEDDGGATKPTPPIVLAGMGM